MTIIDGGYTPSSTLDQATIDPILRQAQRLAVVLWEKHCRTDPATNWMPANNLRDVLLQIDNMTAGLVRPEASAVLSAVENLRSGTLGMSESAPAGARVEESPGDILTDKEREVYGLKPREPGPAPSEPTHILCIGWETIRRLTREGMVWDEEHQAGIVAADDLFGSEFIVGSPFIKATLSTGKK